MTPSPAHQQAVLLSQAGAAVLQVLQRTQELCVLAHKEAVVSPTLQNSTERQGRASPAWGTSCRATGRHLPGAHPAGPQGFTGLGQGLQGHRASPAWGTSCRATGFHLPGAETAGPQAFARDSGKGARASHQPQSHGEPSLPVPVLVRVRVLVAKGGMWGLIPGGDKGLHVQWGTTGL